MKKAIFFVLALSLLLSTQVMASGSSGGSSGAPSASSQDPLTITETLKCVVTAVKGNGIIMVRDKEGEPEHAVVIRKDTKLTAQDKKAFGRKKLDFADLKVGQKLKVSHRPATGQVMSVKVLKAS